MRRVLGAVLPALVSTLLVLGVAACGDDEGGTAGTDDPTPTVSESPTKAADGESVEFELVEIITETAAGGSVSTAAVPLGDDDAVQQFTSQFETDTMDARISDAIHAADVPDDMVLYGAVVAIGCDTPTEVAVTPGDAGLTITAAEAPGPEKECFAPMTTVALVMVPSSASASAVS